MRRAALVSAAIHALIAAAIVLVAWLAPAIRTPPPAPGAEIEMILNDPGRGEPPAAPPPAPAPAPAPAQAAPQQEPAKPDETAKPEEQPKPPEAEAAEPLPLPPPPPPPPPARQVARPVPTPAPAPAAEPPPPNPAPKAADSAVRLGAGSEPGETDAIAGDIPVSPDPSAPNRPPRYPPDAARRGQQGTVILRLEVGSDGHVTDVGIADSSGVRSLDHAAADAASRWLFRPKLQYGEAISSVTLIRIRFVLD